MKEIYFKKPLRFTSPDKNQVHYIGVDKDGKHVCQKKRQEWRQFSLLTSLANLHNLWTSKTSRKRSRSGAIFTLPGAEALMQPENKQIGQRLPSASPASQLPLSREKGCD